MKNRFMLVMLCIVLFGINVYADEGVFEAKKSGVVITIPDEFENLMPHVYWILARWYLLS